MPVQIIDRPNGRSEVPPALEPVLPLSAEWNKKAAKWLQRFQWEVVSCDRRTLAPLWEDPLTTAPPEDVIIKLPRNTDEGGYDIVKQKCLQAPSWPTPTLQSVAIQWGRVRKHGGGLDGEIRAMEEIAAAIDRDIKRLEKLAAAEKANPPPPAPDPVPAPPPKPPPEFVEMKSLPATAVTVVQLPWPVFRLDGICRSMVVLCDAAAVPQLLARLQLTPEELYTPAAGALAGKPCLVLSEADPVGPGEGGRLLYGPPATFAIAACRELTRLFSRPKAVTDLEARRKAGAEADRKARLQEDLARQDRQKADAAAVEAARLRNDPRHQLKEMHARLAKLEAERQQQTAEEAADLQRRIDELEAEKKRKDTPPG
jgi:hypothetical protein